MLFQNKYLKYKQKYLALKKIIQIGGSDLFTTPIKKSNEVEVKDSPKKIIESMTEINGIEYHPPSPNDIITLLLNPKSSITNDSGSVASGASGASVASGASSESVASSASDESKSFKTPVKTVSATTTITGVKSFDKIEFSNIILARWSQANKEFIANINADIMTIPSLTKWSCSPNTNLNSMKKNLSLRQGKENIDNYININDGNENIAHFSYHPYTSLEMQTAGIKSRNSSWHLKIGNKSYDLLISTEMIVSIDANDMKNIIKHNYALSEVINIILIRLTEVLQDFKKP